MWGNVLLCGVPLCSPAGLCLSPSSLFLSIVFTFFTAALSNLSSACTGVKIASRVSGMSTVEDKLRHATYYTSTAFSFFVSSYHPRLFLQLPSLIRRLQTISSSLLSSFTFSPSFILPPETFHPRLLLSSTYISFNPIFTHPSSPNFHPFIVTRSHPSIATTSNFLCAHRLPKSRCIHFLSLSYLWTVLQPISFPFISSHSFVISLARVSFGRLCILVLFLGSLCPSRHYSSVQSSFFL